jgi:hypothetical protein
VPIRPFLDRDDAFGPEDIAPMSAAFEAALGKLGSVDRNDPAITMAIAKLIIEFAKDRSGCARLALQQLSKGSLGRAAVLPKRSPLSLAPPPPR